jgi:hypothetical protein
MTDLPDYPLSIFRAALASTVGRAVSFVLVLLVAPIVPITVFLLCSRGGLELRDVVDLLRPETLLFLCWIFFRHVLTGLQQGWGLIADALLCLLFAAHAWWEWRTGPTLLAVFLVVSMEGARVHVQARGLQALPLSGILVFLALWLCGLASLAFLIFRGRRIAPSPYPLTGGRGGKPAPPIAG